MTVPAAPTATLIYRRQKHEVPAGLTAREAMRRCHLEPDLMLVVYRGEVVQDDLVLQPGDQIRLVPAVLGG